MSGQDESKPVDTMEMFLDTERNRAIVQRIVDYYRLTNGCTTTRGSDDASFLYLIMAELGLHVR